MAEKRNFDHKDFLEFQFEEEFPNSLNGQGIYAIKNTLNGRMYIGSSKNIRSRIFQHLNSLEHKQNNHHSSFLQFAWNKYGKSNFSIIILEVLDKEKELIFREQYWIDYFNSYDEGYNARPRAEANYGIKWSIKQNEARRKSNIKTWSNPVLRNKLSKRFKGWRPGKWTKSSHKKASESMRAKHKENPEWREKIKQILLSPEIQQRR
ncbi:MAG: GIY-YIG nuclease family protein [Saprospiraceae bacterium]